MVVRATVRGDREIIRNIQRAYRSINGQFLDQSVPQALEPMREQTEDNARALRNYVGKYSAFFPQPYKRVKHLDEGVRIAKIKGTGNQQREYWVAFHGRARKLAHLVEFGTAPHFQQNFKGGFHHPGSSPRPFFRPAFESTKDDVMFDLSRRMWTRISGSIIQGFKP